MDNDVKKLKGKEYYFCGRCGAIHNKYRKKDGKKTKIFKAHAKHAMDLTSSGIWKEQFKSKWRREVRAKKGIKAKPTTKKSIRSLSDIIFNDNFMIKKVKKITNASGIRYEGEIYLKSGYYKKISYQALDKGIFIRKIRENFKTLIKG